MRPGFAIYALTPQGAALAWKIAAHCGGTVFLAASLRPGLSHEQAAGSVFFERLGAALAENFPAYPCHVLICASGIAVRALAPLLRGKELDPAVLLLDQRGQFVISLLSGHLGGANALAGELAAQLGATAVITTGTDLEGAPAIDVLAQAANLRILNLEATRMVNAALLRGEKPLLFDPDDRLQLAGSGLEVFFDRAATLEAALQASRAAILVEASPSNPPGPGLLCLERKSFWLGLGCRRGVSKEQLHSFARQELNHAGIAWRDLAGLASLDLKADEPGLLELAADLRLPLRFFSAAELDAIAVPSPSERVKSATGTASVCEAAALLAARLEAGQGREVQLLIGKRKGPGLTLALAGSAPPWQKPE